MGAGGVQLELDFSASYKTKAKLTQHKGKMMHRNAEEGTQHTENEC